MIEIIAIKRLENNPKNTRDSSAIQPVSTKASTIMNIPRINGKIFHGIRFNELMVFDVFIKSLFLLIKKSNINILQKMTNANEIEMIHSGKFKLDPYANKIKHDIKINRLKMAPDLSLKALLGTISEASNFL